MATRRKLTWSPVVVGGRWAIMHNSGRYLTDAIPAPSGKVIYFPSATDAVRMSSQLNGVTPQEDVATFRSRPNINMYQQDV